MSELIVACGGDFAYLPHTAAMLHSVVEHRGDLDVHAYYLHEPGLPADDGRALARMVDEAGGRLTLVEIADAQIDGLPPIEHSPPALWYRTFLPELVDADRILYLDGDTIAVDDLGPLWATELGDAYLGAVTNVWEPWNAGFPASLGLDEPGQYFNSGVLLLNLAAMRADGISRAVLEYALEHRDSMPFGDQDALNVVLGHRRLALHPRWNCMNALLALPSAVDVFGADALREARERPGVRHFEGPSLNKPWHYMCPFSGRDEYLRHRRATPWADFVPDERTPRNRARRAWRSLKGPRISV